MERYIKPALAIICGILSYALGGWSILLEILLVFIVADYVTGLIASGVEGKLSSKVGSKGIFKKVMVLVMVAVANFADQLLNTGSALRDATALFYVTNELLSIIENAGRSGVPVPEVLKKAVTALQSKQKDDAP